MKNQTVRSNSDNIAIAAILAVSLLALAASVFTSNPANANQHTAVSIQKMDTVVVTARRLPATTLETLVVTASRIRHA